MARHRPTRLIGPPSTTSAKAHILQLPLEMRFEIYLHLDLELDYSIPIGDHPAWLDTTKPVAERPLHHLKALILVNKQLYHEVNEFFFSRNSFTIGTGDSLGGSHYSLIYPTIQAFTNFVAMVPQPHIGIIKNVQFHVHLRKSIRRRLPADKEDWGLGPMDDVRALHQMAQSIGRKFTGLRKLHLAVGTADGSWNPYIVDFHTVDGEKHIAKIIREVAMGSNKFSLRVDICDRFDRQKIRYHLDEEYSRLRIARPRPSFKIKTVPGFYNKWADQSVQDDQSEDEW